MRNLIHTVSAVGVAAAVATVRAACGGSGGGSTPAAASTPTTAASAGAGGGSGVQAYLACLRQHGANIPTSFARPTNRPTDRPSGGFGGRGGGGFFGGGQSQSPQMQAAMQACVSVRPTGGFGGGFGFGGRGGTQAVAFRNCMTQQGVVVPTTRPTSFPTARPTNNAVRYLNGLDPNDPKVAAALKVCSPLLPTPGARPSSAPTG